MTKPASSHVTAKPDDRPAPSPLTAAPPAAGAADVSGPPEPLSWVQVIALVVWAGGFLLLFFLLFLDLLVGLFTV
jgi:hypothetical protein